MMIFSPLKTKIGTPQNGGFGSDDVPFQGVDFQLRDPVFLGVYSILSPVAWLYPNSQKIWSLIFTFHAQNMLYNQPHKANNILQN